MEVKNKQQGIKVVADVLDIVGGKWRGQILAHLCDNPKRFNELKTILSKITSSTLTKELRFLEEIKKLDEKSVEILEKIQKLFQEKANGLYFGEFHIYNQKLNQLKLELKKEDKKSVVDQNMNEFDPYYFYSLYYSMEISTAIKKIVII